MDIARVLAIQAFAVSGGVLDLGRMLFQFVGYHLMRLCVIELEGLLLFNVSCQVPREESGEHPHAWFETTYDQMCVGTLCRSFCPPWKRQARDIDLLVDHVTELQPQDRRDLRCAITPKRDCSCCSSCI